MADLKKKSPENIEHIISSIQGKLQMINAAAMKPESFTESSYEDLLELYEMVMSKDRFSPRERQAIVEELGNLKK